MHQMQQEPQRQLSLFDPPPPPPAPPQPQTIQERFEAFHASHPDVYRYLLQQVRSIRETGLTRYGIGALYERARWHFQIEKGLGEDFKLNNNYRSHYARKLMSENPQLEGFFETRELRS